MNIANAFGAAAKSYDQVRGALIPDYDAVYGAAVGALTTHLANGGRVLDIGSGTGAFAAELANACPKCSFVLSDISQDMLAQAQEKFAGDDRFLFLHANVIADPLPGLFDAVISSYVIHHITHAEKATLFTRVAEQLKPGGMFVNLDQFSVGDAAGDAALRAEWERDVRAAGVDEDSLVAAIGRMDDFDCNALAPNQLGWLKAGGFSAAEIIYEKYFWAVFVAQK